jgi:hypothetical protein
VTAAGDAVVADPLELDPLELDPAAAAAASRFAEAVALAVPWFTGPETFVATACVVASAGSFPAAMRVAMIPNGPMNAHAAITATVLRSRLVRRRRAAFRSDAIAMPSSRVGLWLLCGWMARLLMA